MSSEDSAATIDLPAVVSDSPAADDSPLATVTTTAPSLATLVPIASSRLTTQPTTTVQGGQSLAFSPTSSVTGSTSSGTSPAGSTSGQSYIPIPLTAAAGSLVMTQPAASAGADAPLYKIAPGASVTFGWRLSDVIATPTYLSVAAIAGGRTYPVGAIGTLPGNLVVGTKAGEPGVVEGTATQVVWDLDAYQQANPDAQLLQTTYTLSIWDDRGPQAIFRPGYMLPNAQLKFSLYTPQAYQSLEDGWTCATCTNASAILLAHPASVSLVVTILIAFFSGFHLLRANPARA